MPSSVARISLPLPWICSDKRHVSSLSVFLRSGQISVLLRRGQLPPVLLPVCRLLASDELPIFRQCLPHRHWTTRYWSASPATSLLLPRTLERVKSSGQS